MAKESDTVEIVGGTPSMPIAVGEIVGKGLFEKGVVHYGQLGR